MTEPRTQEFNLEATKAYKKIGYSVFDGAVMTYPLNDAVLSNDGAHYVPIIDDVISYVLLSGICNEIATRAGTGKGKKTRKKGPFSKSGLSNLFSKRKKNNPRRASKKE